MNKKAVAFSLYAGTKDNMAIIVERLSQKCHENGLELCERYLLGSLRISNGENDHNNYKYDLYIPKVEGITYNQIYKLVNSVKVCRFKIISI